MSGLPNGWSLEVFTESIHVYQPATIAVKNLSPDGRFNVYGANGIIGKHTEFNHSDSELVLGCRGSVGAVHVTTPNSWINGNAMVVRPDLSKLSKDWVKFALLGGIDTSPAVTGTAQPQITRQSLSYVQIPVPPLDEQKRIVEILEQQLSRLEAATKSLELVQERIASLPKATFQNLLEANADESKIMPFHKFITLQRGFDLPKQAREVGEYPIVASNGTVGTHLSFKVSGPGVVTGRSGTIGRVQFVESDFWPLNTTLYVKDFQGNDPKFVSLFLEAMQLSRYAGGSTVPSLDRNVLSDLEVRIPNLEAQRRISQTMHEVVEGMDVKVEGLIELNTKFVNLRRALLNAAFTGQLTKEPANV